MAVDEQWCGLLQVNSVHVNPVDNNLVATASNDWTVRLHDVRKLGTAAADIKGWLYCRIFHLHNCSGVLKV